ncbi:MAG: alanyl-tRNA editing protein AlaX [Thermoproteota archaeon]|nr:MAG: alanyl-tRNA editing protein AlaX [Candidatus Korarchaeota archaeon]
MPTRRLYYEDPYIRRFESEVVSCSAGGERARVVLRETAFYPESGGQPNDVGLIRGPSGLLRVDRVYLEGEEVVHEGELSGSLALGERAVGEIDWDRRYRLMRMHTAAHVLMEAVRRVMGSAPIAGSGLGLERSRMDFALRISRGDLPRIQEECDSLVSMDAPVRAVLLSREEASRLMAKYGLELGPGYLEPVRIVEIEGVGADPCGGTHVSRTSEIGRIAVLKRDSKGRGITRILFTVEP